MSFTASGHQSDAQAGSLSLYSIVTRIYVLHVSAEPNSNHFMVFDWVWLWAMMIVWRIRAKIIRTVPCCIVYQTVHSRKHTHISMHFLHDELYGILLWVLCLCCTHFLGTSLLYIACCVFASARWAIHISWPNAVCLCLCVWINQGGTNRNRCTQRLVILRARTY